MDMPDNPNHWYEGTQINEDGQRVPVEAEKADTKKRAKKDKADDE